MKTTGRGLGVSGPRLQAGRDGHLQPLGRGSRQPPPAAAASSFSPEHLSGQRTRFVEEQQPISFWVLKSERRFLDIQANLFSNLYLPHNILVPCLSLGKRAAAAVGLSPRNYSTKAVCHMGYYLHASRRSTKIRQSCLHITSPGTASPLHFRFTFHSLSCALSVFLGISIVVFG